MWCTKAFRSRWNVTETLLVNAPLGTKGPYESGVQEVVANFLANGLALLVGCARFAHVSPGKLSKTGVSACLQEILRFNYR